MSSFCVFLYICWGLRITFKFFYVENILVRLGSILPRKNSHIGDNHGWIRSVISNEVVCVLIFYDRK